MTTYSLVPAVFLRSSARARLVAGGGAGADGMWMCMWRGRNLTTTFLKRSLFSSSASVMGLGGETKIKTTHVERTAAEPREEGLHTLTISHLSHPNTDILLLRLSPTVDFNSTSSHSSSFASTASAASDPISARKTLSSSPTLKSLPLFKPGQWIDLFLPGLPKPGGFTITNSPLHAQREGYLELAVQKSKGNPAAAWLWGDDNGGGGDRGVLSSAQNEEDIDSERERGRVRSVGQREEEGDGKKRSVLGRQVNVRVGGSFVWPPPHAALPKLKDVPPGDNLHHTKDVERVVFIAGGVGINPLMSMLSHLTELKSELKSNLSENEARNDSVDGGGIEGRLGFKIIFLYSSKDVSASEGEILFLSRLKRCFEILGEEGELKIFLTGDLKFPGTMKDSKRIAEHVGNMDIKRGRIERADLLNALGPVEQRGETVVYVCGVPTMTDGFVKILKGAEGMREGNVLCERWW